MNLDTAYNKSQAMQASSLWTSIYGKSENRFNPMAIQRSRDNFYTEIIPSSKEFINRFLSAIDVDGIDIEYSYRLIPERYRRSNFTHENEAGNTVINYKKDDTGLTTVSDAQQIRLAENTPNHLENLTHEMYHGALWGYHLALDKMIKNDSQKSQEDKNFLKDSVIEGSVELLKQITLSFNDVPDKLKTYKNRVSLMAHLLESVAKKLGSPEQPNYKLAIKLMINWGSVGHPNTGFAVLCKQIQTPAFPSGFDLYSVEKPQMDSLKLFLDGKHYTYEHIQEIANRIKNSTN